MSRIDTPGGRKFAPTTPSVMLSPNAMYRVNRSLSSGGVMVIGNEHDSANSGMSAVQVTVDVPMGNDVPETGAQDPLSTAIPATVGTPQVMATGKASSDCRATGTGHDMSAATGLPGGVGAVGASLAHPAARMVTTSAQGRNGLSIMSVFRFEI